MSNPVENWLEELDELISSLHDLPLPAPVKIQLESHLTQVQEEVQEQMELRSTDWSNE